MRSAAGSTPPAATAASCSPWRGGAGGTTSRCRWEMAHERGRRLAALRSRRRRRLLRAGAGQPRPAPPDRRPLPDRSRHAARAPLRPHPAGCRRVARRRQPLLRLAGAPAGVPHGTRRRVRAALRHQHRVGVRPRLPDHAAREAGRRSRGRGRSGPHRVAGRTGRHARLRPDRARAGAGRRPRAPGHAARRPALHPGRHRTRLHLAGLLLPHLRATHRRARDARHRAGHLLRTRPLAGRPAGWPGRGGRRHPAGLADGRRAGRDAAAVAWAPSAGGGAGRPRGRSRRPPPDRVLLGHPADEPVQRHRLAAEHRERRGGGRPLSHRALAGDERDGQRGRGLLRLVLPDHDLHRPSRLEGHGRPRRATRC